MSKTLFTQPFPPILKDYYDSLLENKIEKINTQNTATGTDNVIINAKSGVAIFTTAPDASPNVTTYTISNNLLQGGEQCLISVQSSSDDSFVSLLGYHVSQGFLYVFVNDGDSGNATNPVTVAFNVIS